MLEEAPFHAALAEAPPETRAVWARTDDGKRIRLAIAEAESPEGTVLLFPGRTEYVEKYGRTAADLTAAGFSVMAVDWRGQGLSDRLLPDARTGHVDLFADYQRDVAAAVAAAEELGLPRPWHLLAHSMGGCIGLRALTEGLEVASAVFTGPMWGISISTAMRPAAWALSWSGARFGLGHLTAPGTKPESYVVTESFESNLLTRDTEMYAYMRRQVTEVPELALGGPSLRWLNEALVECRELAQLPAPDLPCLTFLGTNERIVDTARIETRMARWPGGRLVHVDGGEHEVLMDDPKTRAEVLSEIVAHFRGTQHRDEEAARA
ncbi:alpha/beta fold hydrolase [Litorisediminicola beolgyonensis]|uniref:Alpha/beta fold hydrolase n=1 Tax=Litorisediminicola beolgyonensis TaxID=1173614 RepID=A0ABW3ZJX0_9RHOB